MEEARPGISELLNDADRLLWGYEVPSEVDTRIVIGNAILASALLVSNRIERLERAVRESGLEQAMNGTRDRWRDRLPLR
jgi:hypothetical protein